MVPVLTIDGEIRAKGTGKEFYTLGEKADFIMTLQSGKETETVKNTLTCGSMYSVTFDAQNITAEELEG
ncbi:MAG: hypothetical protein IJ429_06425, partial [Lachnospiraceae bacterium]|nr:hypothetical protein [Lachnospiraceae bacterium]